MSGDLPQQLPDLYYYVVAPLLPPDEADATLVAADISVPPEDSLASFGIPHVIRCPESRITEYLFGTVTHVCLKYVKILRAHHFLQSTLSLRDITQLFSL